MKIKEKSLKGFKDHLLEANKTVHVYAQVHSSMCVYINLFFLPPHLSFFVPLSFFSPPHGSFLPP